VVVLRNHSGSGVTGGRGEDKKNGKKRETKKKKKRNIAKQKKGTTKSPQKTEGQGGGAPSGKTGFQRGKKYKERGGDVIKGGDALG